MAAVAPTGSQLGIILEGTKTWLTFSIYKVWHPPSIKSRVPQLLFTVKRVWLEGLETPLCCCSQGWAGSVWSDFNPGSRSWLLMECLLEFCQPKKDYKSALFGSCVFICFGFLTQGLTIEPQLALNSESFCFRLLNPRINNCMPPSPSRILYVYCALNPCGNVVKLMVPQNSVSQGKTNEIWNYKQNHLLCNSYQTI